MAYFQDLERWKYYDKDTFERSIDNKTITKHGHALQPCYGSIIEDYNSIGVHHWKIAITYLKNKACIIAIDEASHQWIDKKLLECFKR